MNRDKEANNEEYGKSVCVYLYLFDKGVGGAGMKSARNITCRHEGRERMTRDKV